MNPRSTIKTSLLAIAVLGLLAPSAAALPSAQPSDRYVVLDEEDGRLAVWEETNGFEDLQTEETTTEDGDTVSADERKSSIAFPGTGDDVFVVDNHRNCSGEDFVDEIVCRAGGAVFHGGEAVCSLLCPLLEEFDSDFPSGP